MVLAQEKYIFPNQLNQEVAADVRQSPAKNSRAEMAKIRNRTAKAILAIVALFLAGVFIAITYIYPTQLGYRQVTLEKELAQIEKENKQLELTIAKGRSLERVEGIAVSKLNMVRAEDTGLSLAAHSTTSSTNPSKVVTASNQATLQPVKQMVAIAPGAAVQGTSTSGAASPKATAPKAVTPKTTTQGMRTKASVTD